MPCGADAQRLRDEMGHWHPASAGSDEFLRLFLLALLGMIALCFEKVAHGIAHRLQHAARQHDAAPTVDAKPAVYKAQLSLKLWNRAQGELTVLGFLALIVWIANRIGVLDVMAHMGGSELHGHAEATPRGHGESFHGGDVEHGRRHLHSSEHLVAGPLQGYCWPGSLGYAWMPPSGAELIHVLEDVHSEWRVWQGRVHRPEPPPPWCTHSPTPALTDSPTRAVTLFLTMVAYFAVMQWSLQLLIGEFEKLAASEPRPPERFVLDATGDARIGPAPAPAPAPTSTAVKIDSIRKRLVAYYLGDSDCDGVLDEEEMQRRLEKLDPAQREVMRDLHEQLFATTPRSATANAHTGASDSAPAVPVAAALSPTPSSSPGGACLEFSVPSILFPQLSENVEELILFDDSAWGVVMLYAIICIALTRSACFSDVSALSVAFGVDAIWISSSLYAALRVYWHDSVLSTPVQHTAAPGRAQQPWPHIWIDRLCFPLHFGVVGSFPWSRTLSEERALNSFQALLFFQLYSVVESLVILTFSTAEAAPYFGLVTSRVPLLLIVATKLSFIALWACYILPRLITAFALPPFITAAESEKLDAALAGIHKKLQRAIRPSLSGTPTKRYFTLPSDSPPTPTSAFVGFFSSAAQMRARSCSSGQNRSRPSPPQPPPQGLML